jgi:hypothetical protein
MERKGFTALLNMPERDDVLIVTKLDRLGRNQRMSEKLEAAGVPQYVGKKIGNYILDWTNLDLSPILYSYLQNGGKHVPAIRLPTQHDASLHRRAEVCRSLPRCPLAEWCCLPSLWFLRGLRPGERYAQVQAEGMRSEIQRPL